MPKLVNQLSASPASARNIPARPAYYYRMHGDTGISITEARSQHAGVAVQGTTTDIWTDRHAGLRPRGNNHVKLVDATLRGLLDASLCAAQQDIICVHVQMTMADVASSGNETIWCVGATTSALGGYGLRVTTNRYPILMWRPLGAAVVAQQLSLSAISPEVRHSMMIALDCSDPATPVATYFYDGVLTGSFTLAAGTGIPAAPVNAAGLMIGARQGSAPNYDPYEFVAGNATPAQIKIENLHICRMALTEYAELQVLATQLHQMPGEFPPILRAA